MRRFGVLVASSVFASTAMAVPITYEFTGEVTNATGVFVGRGSAITGSFFFDDALISDGYQQNPSLDIFTQTDPLSHQPSFGMTVSLGELTSSVLGWGRMEIWDAPVQDKLSIQINRQNQLPSPYLELIALDVSYPSEPDGVAIGSNGLTNSVAGAEAILDRLDLSLFHGFDLLQSTKGAWIEWGPPGAAPFGEADFVWTSIHRVIPVPEPDSSWLVCAGLLILWQRARRYASESRTLPTY